MIEAQECPIPRNDRIWVIRTPEPNTRYTIGVDAATGFGPDYTSMQVFSNIIPFEQVAWFRHNRISTTEGSRLMLNMARWYNNAMLVIETRYPGNAYQDNALDPKFAGGKPYGNCYQRVQVLDEDPNQSSKFGINTTEADKHLLVNEAKGLLEAPDGPQVILHDEVTIMEFLNYIYLEEKAKMGAPQGDNDDTVMATMLALHGCIRNPQRPFQMDHPTPQGPNHQMRMVWKRELERRRKGWSRGETTIQIM